MLNDIALPLINSQGKKLDGKGEGDGESSTTAKNSLMG